MEGIILIPLNTSKTHFETIIESQGQEHRVEIICGEHFKDSSIKCDWRLKQKLKNHVNVIESKILQCQSPSDFLLELKKLLNEVDHPNPQKSSSVEYCTAIVKHIEELGWEKVEDVSNDLTSVTLKASDLCGRNHSLTLHFNAQYPKEHPEITTDLPLPFRPIWGGEFSNLLKLYQQFVDVLPLYQRLWDDLDELKNKCWILEPENPNYAAKEYRIALGTSSSVLIIIDPLHPENPPECRFLGAEMAVLPIRENYLSNIQEWNESLSLYQNLKNILQTDFPHKTDQAMDVSLQCGICYSYRLGNDVPEQACNETRCGQLFHHECLVEWIRSVPGAKQSFQTLFGECPYCNSAITVKLGARN